MNNNDAVNSIVINILSEKQTVKTLTQHVLQLCAMLETHDTQHVALRTKQRVTGEKKERDYGPKSQRKMTRLDAWEIMYGDRCNQKARQIADETGLSRGQVYSVQGGYTFRDVKIEEFGESKTNEEIWTERFVGPLQLAA